jgi:transcriptional regulator with XRE-family HTH domain
LSNIGERIRSLRKALNLSQTEFGERWGVGLGVIRNIETSKTIPSTAQIDLICTVYNVNRAWLESGEGEMFADRSLDEKIGRFIAEALSDESDDFKRRLISILVDLDLDGWRKLREAAEVLADLTETDKKEGE